MFNDSKQIRAENVSQQKQKNSTKEVLNNYTTRLNMQCITIYNKNVCSKLYFIC
jgi:hypothetical protein